MMAKKFVDEYVLSTFLLFISLYVPPDAVISEERFHRILGLSVTPPQLMQPQPNLTAQDPFRHLPGPSDILLVNSHI